MTSDSPTRGTDRLAAAAAARPLPRRLLRDRRGAVAVMVGVMSPMLLGILAITVDSGFWMVAQTRLQVAADAGAMGVSFLLTSSSFKAQSAVSQQSTAAAVAQAEVTGAATRLVGTINTPSVSIASGYSSVTVSLTSNLPKNYFGAVFNIAAPVVRATAIARLKPGGACLLTLGTSGNGIQVDNSGAINATGCTVASKASIYLNSGTIVADKLVAAGTISQSNSGSNTMTTNTKTQSSAGSVPADSYSGAQAPTPGTCATGLPDYTKYGTYTANPGTWCGDITIGGNGSTITFNPGVYIISEGNLTFNNASITSAAGVSFVLVSTKAGEGNFSWTNNSNSTTSITAPTSGPTKGMAIWQSCNANNSTQTTSFQGGSTLAVGGTVYTPCSSMDIGNNAKLSSAQNGSIDLVTKSIYVHGSAGLTLKPGTGSSNTPGTVLSQ